MLRLILAVTTLGLLAVGCGGAPMKTDAGVGGGAGGGSATGGGSAMGGGSATGGGAATGGGSGADAGTRTCLTAPPFTAANIQGKPGFDPGSSQVPPYNYATFALTETATQKVNVMFNELYTDGPLANVTIPAKTYAQCDLCFIISTGCNSMGGMCAAEYLAQAGRLTVSEATKSPDAGTYAFTLQDVTYTEWDFGADAPVPDGGCMQLGTFAYTGTWP